jgi:hypothetical protein
MSFILPPLLTSFAVSGPLEYSGGAATVGHILDWREMAAKPTVSRKSRTIAGSASQGAAWSGGHQVGVDETVAGDSGSVAAVGIPAGWDYGVDDRRGWLIGLGWIIACLIE